MSVAICLEINARLRSAGVTVREASGWQNRGNGQSSAYEGGLIHHTATGFGIALPGTGVGNLLINGRPDLKGPLCNYAGNDDGSITVIAAHPANHAGASGGRSMGPLPTTRSFNRRVLGLEIVYPGTSPMRPAQYRSALVWARVVADVVGGGNIERVRAHAETSVTGKWDPGDAPGRTINMAAFRRAATTPTIVEDDVSAEDVWGYSNPKVNPIGDAYKYLLQTYAVGVETQRRVTAGNAAIAALAELVAKGTNGLTAAQVGDVVEARVVKALAENTVNVDIDVSGGVQ
jgi:hypothetical protein